VCKKNTEDRIAEGNKKRKEVMDKYAKLGYFASWCDNCGGTTLHCPECQTNTCSGVAGCPTCKVVAEVDRKFWAEISPIEDVMFNGYPEEKEEEGEEEGEVLEMNEFDEIADELEK
jgi:hypothetical protein